MDTIPKILNIIFHENLALTIVSYFLIIFLIVGIGTKIFFRKLDTSEVLGKFFKYFISVLFFLLAILIYKFLL
jgi:hypothetical protein